MRRAILLGAVALALVPAVSGAQTPTRRRQAAIEIRGQVPTPQVVTVRPREVPAYSRQVISPNFYDRNFWPSILPGYQLVPQRMITGTAPMDSGLVRDSAGAAGAADTSRTPGAAQPMTLRPPPGTPPAANLRTAPPSSGTTPADSARTTRPDSARTVPPDSGSGAGTPPAPARR